MASSELLNIIELLVFPGILFLIAYALVCEWVDRRFYARLQNRYGPIYAGWKGILQPLADLIKLLAKEDITPAAADRRTFFAVPLFLLALPLTIMYMIPILGPSAYVHFEGDLILVMFFMILLVLAVFIGGWSSVNRFSAVGGMRAALQMLSYEIPLGLAAVGPAILASSVSISGIVQWQADSLSSFLKGPTTNGVIMGAATAAVMAIGFGIFTICMLAELEKVPFDAPEAETEIVSGWQAEFSGRKLALIRLGSSVKLVLASGLLTALFLGGPIGFAPVPGAVWFIVKSLFCVLVMSNLRALFARFRIDQTSSWLWKSILPLAVLYLVTIELLAGVM